MRVRLAYGDGEIHPELPDDATVVRGGSSPDEPAGLPDPVAATRAAITEPVGSAPLRQRVSSGSRVTIAFPDRVKGGTQATAHRKVAIPLLVAELERTGVRRRDITLVCAIGLHRKNSPAEFADYLGREVLDLFEPDQVVNHDAESPGIVQLADSELGDPVGMNRLLIDSDLTIQIGHTAGNPYGGFSGGYKMPATGLTTWRSIRRHHSPATMHRPDFSPPSVHSHFRHQLSAIGRRMESAMPQPIFAVDAVLNARSEQLAVAAGGIEAVQEATWPVAASRTEVTLPGPPADVLVLGLPRRFHYGNGMGSNPILLTQAIGASLIRARAALVEQPVIIAAAVCDGWYNEEEFASYEHTYERLQQVGSPAGMVRVEDELCTVPRYLQRYRDGLSYHPFHAFSMVYMGGLAREQARAVFIAGAQSPAHAAGMGAIGIDTVEHALAEAESLVGHRPRTLVIPDLSEPAYHLRSDAD